MKNISKVKIIFFSNTVGAEIIGVTFFMEKANWHKPDLSIIISNKVMTF